MQNRKLSLDIFRQNDLGYSLCHIYYKSGGICIPFVFNDYYNLTTANFVLSLKYLENIQGVPIAYNPELLQIFTSYFACFEQFVSTLYEILYFYKVSSTIPDEEVANKLFRQDYKIIIDKIFEIIETDKIEYNKTGLINKIAELERARNYILHGNIGKIKIKKTKIPDSPLTINYEDIMEELDILINFINFFRYTFPEIDLMPNIKIIIGRAIFFKALDEYFYKVLIPYFNSILQKHDLIPTKSYSLATKPINPEVSSITTKIGVSIKAKPSDPFEQLHLNPSQTNFYVTSLKNIIDSSEVDRMNKEGKFQLPRFMLKTEVE